MSRPLALPTPIDLLVLQERVRGPSTDDGLTPSEVIEATRSSCRFIKTVCKKLQVSLLGTCTAQVFFHRFFTRQSLHQHDRYNIAITCIFLAAKVEENYQSLDQILTAAFAVRNHPAFRAADQQQSPQPQHAQQQPVGADAKQARQNEISAMNEKILTCERIILQTLSFDIAVDHPHTHSMKMLKSLARGQNDHCPRVLQQTTWNILNDSLSTNVCLRYPPKAIAAAAISLAARFLRHRPDASSGALKRALDNLAAQDKSGDFFGFAVGSLKAVEDELLFAYEEVELVSSPKRIRAM